MPCCDAIKIVGDSDLKKMVHTRKASCAVHKVIQNGTAKVSGVQTSTWTSRKRKAPSDQGSATSAEKEGEAMTVVGKQKKKTSTKVEIPLKKEMTEVKNEVAYVNGTSTATGNKFNGSPCSTGLRYLGAHISAAGGLENAITNAVSIGARSFALFLSSQRTWNRKPLEEETVEKFITAYKGAGYPPHLILPHGSYLLNLGSPDEATLSKSRDLLIDELKRCERLGITQYNVHPGSSCGKISREECMAKIAESINFAHRETKFVSVLLENMSKQGHTIGGDFAELKTIIDQIEDKTRIGVCLDTCHAFAAGYDLRTEEDWKKMIQVFDEAVGLSYLKAMHINDSKGDLGCHLDRHENIGKGKLKKQGFLPLMKMPHFADIPLVLETPCEGDDVYEREIKLLYSLEK
ncbi:unnamed protein product [Darwinula stevensoni]|uniref:Xylose isomerase-like TIM barrel domain-containing protein n=1 Tax=Darwinula stevensoni TaxID=69355 RepID=A0A7R8ZYK5_9CRUS|nr:unnamed protein product [Darwinula stevensoni]CAG0880717.1 unnamed protein product [Darwinula stevensoni]